MSQYWWPEVKIYPFTIIQDKEKQKMVASEKPNWKMSKVIYGLSNQIYNSFFVDQLIE